MIFFQPQPTSPGRLHLCLCQLHVAQIKHWGVSHPRVLTFLHPIPKSSKSSPPCLHNDSRIGPLLDTATATVPAYLPVSPMTPLQTARHGGRVIPLPQPPQWLPMSHMVLPAPRLWFCHQATCTHRHTYTQTLTLFLSPHSRQPPWIRASPPANLACSYPGASELTLSAAAQVLPNIYMAASLHSFWSSLKHHLIRKATPPTPSASVP